MTNFERSYDRGVVPGGAQILADQLTLSQPRGADYAQQIILAPPDFQTFRRPCIKEMHWNYTWLQLYSWSFDAFSSNSYNAWHLLIRCRWQSFRYFQLKLSKNILCTLSAYQSMHHTKQLVEKNSDGAFPPENTPPHYGLCPSAIDSESIKPLSVSHSGLKREW